MKIERKELEAKLKLIQPAIYGKDLVEELTCVWFDGAGLLAYDAEIGIVTPLEGDLKCGLKGGVLVSLVNSLSAAHVDLTQTGDQVAIKAGGSKATLATVPLLRKPRGPDTEGEPIILTADFLTVVKLSGVSNTPNPSRPDYLGTTFVPDNDVLDLYSSDGATATWLMVDKPTGWPDRRIAWPRRFCDQLVRLAAAGDKLILGENSALLKRADKTRLLGNDLRIDRPVDFKAMFKRILPEGFAKQLWPVPDDLEKALKRLAIVLPAGDGVRVDVAEKSITLTALGAKGNVQEVLPISKTQEPVSVKVQVSQLLRALSHADAMLITETAVILEHSETGFLHLLSCSYVPKTE